MSEKRFVCIDIGYGDDWYITDNGKKLSEMEIVDLLNEQQELIEELQVSDEMGWKRAEHFEKEYPKELHNKKMHIKRLEYKVQKFKEMNSEQQATIERLEKENKELGKNFDDLVKWASEISKRNVVLDERIGKIKQGIRLAYEKKPYPTIEDIEKEWEE